MFDYLFSIPWSLYFTFVVEEKHGFNKQTLKLFITDIIKTILISMAIGLPIVSLFLYIISMAGENFFFYIFIFTLSVQIFLIMIYPSFIAPLFDTYTPLEEGELKTEIEELAKKLKFP